MKTALLICCGLAAMSACVQPLKIETRGTPERAKQTGKPRPDTTTAAPQAAIVQIRYYARSPSVTVVAWDPIDPDFGLNAVISREGVLIQDHRMFVKTYYNTGIRAYLSAFLGSYHLRSTGITRDDYNCWNKRCTPLETFGVRIPDDLLRGGTDSIAVRFRGTALEPELMLVMQRDFINKYLEAVDSVTAELKRKKQ